MLDLYREVIIYDNFTHWDEVPFSGVDVSGQIIMFHQPRFPYYFRRCPLLNHHYLGVKTHTCFRSRKKNDQIFDHLF